MQKVGVKFNGRKGVIVKADQKRVFRCPECGNAVSKDDKVLVRPTDNFFDELENEPKVLVKKEDIIIEALL